MTSWISITRILQNAYGVASVHVGIPMNVYRVTDTSNGDYIQDSNLIASNIRIDRQPMKKNDKGFEGTKELNNFWYEIMANCNPFQVGDIFVSNDQVLNSGWVATSFDSDEFVGLCLAENMPTRAPIAARINTTAQLYTASCLPTADHYFDGTDPNRQPIVLSSGIFGPATGTAAKLPIGVMTYRSYGGDIYNNPTPNMPPLEKRLVFIPALNGYQPIASDELVFQDGSRYVLDSNYHQDVGAVGGIYVVRKFVTGAGQ